MIPRSEGDDLPLLFYYLLFDYFVQNVKLTESEKTK